MYFDPASTGTGALSGAATGAIMGSAVPVIGTGLGALGGGLVGAIGGLFSGNASHNAQGGLDQVRAQVEALAKKQYAQRQADLARAMQYFAPVHQLLYGKDAANQFVGDNQAAAAAASRAAG